jgi:hypothetical protein
MPARKRVKRPTTIVTPEITSPLSTDPEVMARARRAVKRFRGMRGTLTGFAKMLTNDDNVRVEAGPMTATDGKTIYITPPIELGDDLRHDRKICDRRDPATGVQLCRACMVEEGTQSSLYHEIAHIAFDSFAQMTEEDRLDVLRRALAERSEPDGTDRASKIAANLERLNPSTYVEAAVLVSPFLLPVINALEDVRVNIAMYKARPGTLPMFQASAFEVFENGIDIGTEVIHWRDCPVNAQAVVALYAKAAQYDYSGWFAPEVEEMLDDPELEKLLRTMRTVRSVRGVYELSYPVLERLRELGFCRAPDDVEADPEPEPESDPDLDSDSSPEPEPADAASEPTGEPEPDDAASEPADDGSEPEPEPEPADDGSEPAPEPEPADDGSEPAPEPADDGSKPAPEPADDGSEPAPEPEPADDGSEPAPEPEPDSDLYDGDDDDFAADWSDDDEMTDGDDDTDGDETSDQDGEGDGDGGAGSDPGDDDEGEPGDESTDLNDGDAGMTTGDSGDHDPADPKYNDADGNSGTPLDDDGDGEPGKSDSGAAGDNPLSGDAGPSPEAGDHGSTSGADPQPDLERDGDADLVERALRIFGNHATAEDQPNADDNDEPETDDDGEPIEPPPGQCDPDEASLEVGRALAQEGLDQPSQSIHAIRLHHYDNPDEFPGQPSERMQGGAWYRTDESKNSGYVYNHAVAMPVEEIPRGVLTAPTMRMRQVFIENRRGKDQRNRKSGARVDGRVLGRRLSTGDDRLFKSRKLPGKRDYFVVIGGDCSGSQSSGSMIPQKMAMWAQAEMCQQTNVPFAMYGHTASWTRDGRGMPNTVVTSEHGQQVVCSLDLYEIKSERDVWDDKARQRLFDLGPAGANLDGHTLEWYRKRAMESNATDRVIMYYTDGEMPAENYNEELEILEREIKLCKRLGIHLMGVGIGTDSPSDYGLDTVQIDTVDEIDKVVRHLEKVLER